MHSNKYKHAWYWFRKLWNFERFGETKTFFVQMAGAPYRACPDNTMKQNGRRGGSNVKNVITICDMIKGNESHACRQCSILSFQYDLLVHFKSYILIQTTLQSEIWFQRYEQFFEFLNNVKHQNLSPLVAYNSKSILTTSDSFP